MSSLAIFTIAIVLIDTVGGVILACIDAKNCSSKTRELDKGEADTSKASHSHLNRKVERA